MPETKAAAMDLQFRLEQPDFDEAVVQDDSLRRDSRESSDSAPPQRPSLGDESELDDFDRFCRQAGWKRRLSSCQDYGGSLPCMAVEAVGPRRRGGIPSRLGQLGAAVSTESTSGFLGVPGSPHMRRTHSDCGDQSQALGSGSTLIGHLSPRSRRQRLWSSIKSLVDSCEMSPQCLSPSSPPYAMFSEAAGGAVFDEAYSCSAPLSRVNSGRKRRRRPRPAATAAVTDMDAEMRPRTSSLPTKGGTVQRPSRLQIDSAPTAGDANWEGDDWRRIRHFVTTPKGIINCGDMRTRSCSSSVRSLVSQGSGAAEGVESIGSLGSLGSGDVPPPPVYKVLITGAAGVGKTTLAQQFLTSECLVERESLSEFEESSTVSVLLDGEEAIIEVVELSCEELREFHAVSDVEAYLVVFSTIDRSGFHGAIDLLYHLRKEEQRDDAVIFVANKTDLVRIRQVAEQEGKSAAETYNCKYTEVSALMNFRVDELLAGIVNQIRLHRQAKSCARSPVPEERRSPIPRFINRILKRQAPVSRSCDNLLVM